MNARVVFYLAIDLGLILMGMFSVMSKDMHNLIYSMGLLVALQLNRMWK